MVLDECIATPATPRRGARGDGAFGPLGAARPPARFEAAHRSRPVIVTNPRQAQFGIIQGATFPDLRTESVQATVEIGFEAYAIGGLSVGEAARRDVRRGRPHGAAAARRTGRAT